MPPWTLPAVNATLNGMATMLLIVGYVLINKKNVDAHRKVMMSAFGVSAIFLICYLTDKAIKGGAHTAFHGEGAIRVAYYAMLFSHILLAIAVPVFAIMLIRFGLKGEIEKHRKLAKVAYPIWLYVSITGVVIFFALYVWNPSSA